MDSSKKLYIALVVLVALGAGVYLQQQDEKKDAVAHSLSAKGADLPSITVDEATKKSIDTIEIFRPAKEAEEGAGGGGGTEAKPEQKVVLKKVSSGGDKAEDDKAEDDKAEGDKAEDDKDEWELVEPLKYQANASNVKSLLDNLEKLKTQETISSSSDTYEKWGVNDEKALHAVFKKGDEVVLDLYVGDSGSRGQMVRIGGKDGVFVAKGYSKYLYDRDVDAWRNKSVFKFKDKDAERISIKNENGEFEFKREDNKWLGTLDGKAIERFKGSKVDDMLRAYKSLNASKFGDGQTEADVGLTEPKATVTIELAGGSQKYELNVGDNAEGSSRWVKANNLDTIFSISSWSADWATADASKFQEKDEEASKDEDKDDAADEKAEAKDEKKSDVPVKAEKKAEEKKAPEKKPAPAPAPQPKAAEPKAPAAPAAPAAPKE